MAEPDQQQQQQARNINGDRDLRSLMLTYVLFAALGLGCSFVWNSYYHSYPDSMISQHHPLFSARTEQHSLKEVKSVLAGIDCEDVVAKTKLPGRLKRFMASKLRYQFDGAVRNESTIRHCRFTKVYGLLRHGTRYPTAKHMSKWKALQQVLPDKLRLDSGGHVEWAQTAKELLKWPNSLHEDVANGRGGPIELSEWGMKEEYCLGKRLRQRFPVLPESYSSLWCDFWSSATARTMRSAQSFAAGFFEESNPSVISIRSIEEKDDVFLRYDELPCPAYDQKVTFNETLESWIESFFNTSAFQKLMLNVQRYFNPDHWKLNTKDITLFYSICIHETSVLGASRWCDLFDIEDLSVMQFYKDLKAYWVKGGAHSITKTRSVHLTKSILEFLVKSRHTVSLSFAHSETILPLLSFLDVFPVPEDLTPSNYEELRSREFVTSQMVPYGGNVYFILYDCSEETSEEKKKPELYVRLLVNEKPMRMGLCNKSEGDLDESEEEWSDSLSLCKLEVLGKRAYNETEGFSTLSQLCKEH